MGCYVSMADEGGLHLSCGGFDSHTIHGAGEYRFESGTVVGMRRLVQLVECLRSIMREWPNGKGSGFRNRDL